MNHKNHSLNSSPDISIRYTLPRYYIPASLQDPWRVVIFESTTLETAQKMIDSIVESKIPVEVMKIYTETGTEKDTLDEIHNYAQKTIDLDVESIDVVKNLLLVELINIINYYERVSAYRQALRN